MIPFKNLDDKRFFQLLEEARGYIHRYSDEWTDENYHDPGITFLEMLTWLTEMQRFYLSRISDASMTQLIELMGYQPVKSTPASGLVQFHAHKGSLFLPAYTQVQAAEQIFETDQAMDIVDAKVQHIFNYNKGVIDDQTHSNRQVGMNYQPFGDTVEQGELWVVMLDKPLLEGQWIQLYIDLFEGYPVTLNSACSNKHGIKFQLQSALSENSEVLTVEQDATNGFMTSGILRFKSPKDHEEVELFGFRGYPIVINVLEDYELLPPQINEILLNTCFCKNIDHRVQVVTLNKGSNLIQFELAVIGEKKLQKKTEIGWVDLLEEAYSIKESEKGLLINIAEEGDYQLLLWRDSFGEQTIIGSATGFPKCTIRFSSRNVIKESIVLQCGDIKISDSSWQAYNYTDNFFRWGNRDKVFTIDEAEEFIIFGNHEYGFMPEEGDDNIQLITLQKSNFERGNIKSGQIQQFCREVLNQRLTITNPYEFSGGSRGDSDEKTVQKVLTYFKEKETLITTDDYEKALINYSDARILYAKAFTDETVDNRIKLMAVPYNGQRFPKLSSSLMRSLLDYVTEYKMVTTSVDMIDPIYVEVDLHVELLLDQSRLFNRESVYQGLYDLFNPIQGYKAELSYDPGSVPTRGELIERLLKYDGVGGVKRLDINIVNNLMPTNGVIYCNQIHLIYE